jgi:hypothetical protein
MYWDVIEVRPYAPRKLSVTFADGLTGTIFIDHSFCTGVFKVLESDDEINQANVEGGVVVWPNGLDLAPDTMYKMIKNSPKRYYELRR